jgi:hypothetical protein
MEVTFSTAALATLCNSERRLAARWGVDTGRTVGRRLYELGSADVQNLDRLPRVSVSLDGEGETIIDFDAEVIVRGRISANEKHGDGIVITSLEVRVPAQR